MTKAMQALPDIALAIAAIALILMIVAVFVVLGAPYGPESPHELVM